MADEEAVEMFVGGLVLDPATQAPVVVLKDESGDLHLPIWIGIAEATSIAAAIKQISMGRPLTHDLMISVFNDLGVNVERILITELKDSTYFAELVLSLGDKALILDSRPSDAIAIALRAQAPIFVASSVLEQAKATLTGTAEDSGEGSGEGKIADAGEEAEAEDADAAGTDFKNIDKEKWDDILKELDPDDFKYKM